MISVNKGLLHIKGSKPELLSDLALIVHGLQEDIDENLINMAVDLGLKDEEQLEEAKDKVKKALLKLKDELEKGEE